MNNKISPWPINFYRDVFNIHINTKDVNVNMPIDVEETIDFVFKNFLDDIDSKALLAYYRDRESMININTNIYGHPEAERRNIHLHRSLVKCKMAMPRRVLADGKFVFTRSKYMSLMKIDVLELPNNLTRTLKHRGVDTIERLLDSGNKLYRMGLRDIDVECIRHSLSRYDLSIRTNDEISVYSLGVCRATANCLSNRGFATINDVANNTREQLNKIYDINYDTIDIIEEALESHGLKLKSGYSGDIVSLFLGFLTNAINKGKVDVRMSKYADIDRPADPSTIGIAYIHKGFICLTPKVFKYACIQCNIDRRTCLKLLSENENFAHNIEAYIKVYNEDGKGTPGIKVYRIPAHLLNAVSWCI